MPKRAFANRTKEMLSCGNPTFVREPAKKIGGSKKFHPRGMRSIPMPRFPSLACQADGFDPLCLAPPPKGNTASVHLNKERRHPPIGFSSFDLKQLAEIK